MDPINLLETLVKEHKYKDAEKLARTNDIFPKFIETLANNKKMRQIGRIFKNNNIDIDTYPILLDRIRRRYVRYALRIETVNKVELRFLTRKELLIVLVEQLYENQLIDEALCIIQRNDLKDFVVNGEILICMEKEFSYMTNVYLDSDKFGGFIRTIGEFVRWQKLFVLIRLRYHETSDRIRYKHNCNKKYG